MASLKDGRTGEPIHPRKWDSSVTDLPIVNPRKQRRPALRADAINTLVSQSDGKEQALYVLLAATGMRISEALALESKHFVNDDRTIQACQQVDRDKPRIVEYLKTDAASREVDLSTQVAEYLRGFINDRKGLGFHVFRRYRKTWRRGERCQEDINNFWMGHQPETMSELYSRMEFEVERRLAEAENVGVGFTVPTLEIAPNAPSAPSAPRFRSNPMSNWFCNFSRIKRVAKDAPVAQLDRASAF